MVQMISLKRHVYDGRALSEDEEFECEDRFVGILEKLNHAKRKELLREMQPAAAPEYRTRDMQAKRGRPKGRR